MQLSTVNGMGLGSQEWHNTLFLWYGLEPLHQPTYYDGCQAKFSISHILDCKKGNLLTARRNKLCDGVADLDGKAFTSSHVRNNPLIYLGCAMKRTKAALSRANGDSGKSTAQKPEVTEQKGDLIIRELWKQGTDSVHDMRVVNTDAPTTQKKGP